MKDLYLKLKEKLAAADTLHVWLSYVLTMLFAVGFKLIGMCDPLGMILLPPVCAFIVGVFVESFDGYFGTKQLDETGVLGNIFSTKDLLRDAIGCLMAMATIAGLIL